MNRQYAILVYSKSANATACRSLFQYLETLPFDLPAVAGMSLLCVDNPIIRKQILDFQIKSVPTILIKYFNQTQQQIEGGDIYIWIAEVADRMGYTSNTQVDIEPQVQPPEKVAQSLVEPPTPSGAPILEAPQIKTEPVRGILAKALSMQKLRETEDVAQRKKAQ